MRIAYIRVSSIDQNEGRQVEAMKQFNIERSFIDKASGKDIMNRPQLKELMNFAREGDIVYIMDWSRLSRSLSDLIKLIDFFDKKNVTVVSLKEQFDTNTPTGRLMMNLIGAFNQFERENIKARQKEGIELAKKKGVYTGRKPKQFDINYLNQVLGAVKSKQITVVRASEMLDVSRATVYSLMEKYGYSK